MPSKLTNWLLFSLLCLIWGSSFILMKWGMFQTVPQGPLTTLSAYHVASLRMLSSGIVMTPFLFSAMKQVPRKNWLYVMLSGLLGSFFPAFLFCIAETKIDGALAGSLNALTPLFVIVIGVLFFHTPTSNNKIIGVVIGLTGCVLLTFIKGMKSLGDITYIGLILIATLMYGINVNMVHRKLHGIRSIHIAAIAFSGLIPFSLIALVYTGYFRLPLSSPPYLLSTLSSCILGVMGTAVASIMFYMLVKKAGALFASLVTYGIPFVAMAWGIYYQEQVTYLHVVALMVILLGVYIANRRN